MREVYSNDKDSLEIVRELNGKLKDKIYYLNRVSPVIGEYACLSYENYGNYRQWELDKVSFYFKYCQVLRVGIGNGLSPKTMGHKFAALSEFYQVLSEKFGEPTLFYTVCDDKDGTLNLQWSFQNREEDIRTFQSGEAFDDAFVDTLIVMGTSYKNGTYYQLSSETRNTLAHKIGLPFDVISLVEPDYMDDFVKYKTGESMHYPSGSFCKSFSIIKK